MMSKGLISGLLCIVHHKKACVYCIGAKEHHTHISKQASFWTSCPLELVHSNLCGPISEAMFLKCILTFIDDYSKFTYFLTHKSDMFEAFKGFCALIEKQLSTPIKILRINISRQRIYLSRILATLHGGWHSQATNCGTHSILEWGAGIEEPHHPQSS